MSSSSFVPEEDEGYFIAIIQAPPGSSLEYTSNIARQAERVMEICRANRARGSATRWTKRSG